MPVLSVDEAGVWECVSAVCRRGTGGCDECRVNDEKGRQLGALPECRSLYFSRKKGKTKGRKQGMEVMRSEGAERKDEEKVHSMEEA